MPLGRIGEWPVSLARAIRVRVPVHHVMLWRFTDPEDDAYAAASRRGSGASRTTRPLVLEWEPASQIVGDFCWAQSDASVVVAKSVGDALAERFEGFELASRPPVALPYHGPELADLHVTVWAHIDLERSDVRRSSASDDPSYVVEGAESWETGWDLESMRSKRIRVPRTAGGGLYIERSSIMGDIFGVHEFPSWIFCTNEVRTFVQRQEFTNVDFLEMGELF